MSDGAISELGVIHDGQIADSHALIREKEALLLPRMCSTVSILQSQTKTSSAAQASDTSPPP